MNRTFYPLKDRILYLIIILTVIIVSWKNHSGNSDGEGGGKEALSTFELEPGFKIELVADEPLIADPVDMEIDEYGRMYVVEMHGYPLNKTGSGKIKLVTDSDKDGQMDKSTVFADGLTLPNSILRWKKGVMVTDAPYVLYFEDTDNDGRADIKDTLLTGFALSNPQHNLNNPVYGIDNWIYLGHEGAVGTQAYKEQFGDPGSEVYYPGHPESPRLARNASGRSVRFQPDKHLLETLSSNTQFGHTFDASGHYFLVSNANHIFQEVIAAQYLNRNPELVVSNATQNISDHQNAAEVFPITKNPEHQLLTDVGVITSACGITSYQGGAFPAPFNNVTFVAEPVSNLVHVDRIKENGVSFTASRIHPNKEFLASTDSWFRPVNMYIGPDGALYVVDYYRQIIEHPEWMGDEVVKSGKLYNGSDKGRIYRITPKNAPPANWIKGLKLGDASVDELIQQLANPNIWWRLHAQRLLVDRRDRNAVQGLTEMARNTKSAHGRLHALWTLEGLGELTPGVIEQALKDPVAGVRENAIKLADLHLSEAPQLQNSLLSLKADPDKKVRFQLLCTLGSVNTPAASQVRNRLLFKDIREPWMQVAALSAGASQSGALLKVVVDSFKTNDPAYASLVERLSTMIGTSEKPEVIRHLVQKSLVPGSTTQAVWKGALLKGLSQGIKNQQVMAELKGEQNALINAVFANPSKPVRDAAVGLLKVVGLQNDDTVEQAKTTAAAIAANRNRPADKRVEAIRFIALSNPAPYGDLLKNLIAPIEQPAVQLAAMQTLSTLPGTAVSQYLLTKWTDLTPDIRNEAINTFLNDNARIAMLLDALENGIIQKSTIGWPRSVRLMAQRDVKLRDRARVLLTKDEGERAKVNKDYQPALALNGNSANGRNIFFKSCSSCHQVRGSLGVEFGPDLGTIHNWSGEAIMANILAPNMSISSGFDLWAVELKDGSSFQGIISTETPTAITLKNAGNEIRTIKRSEVKSLKALNMSSMPTGLEKQINHQQMADLIAYLKQNK